jgi:signal transduction histidine kinase
MIDALMNAVDWNILHIENDEEDHFIMRKTLTSIPGRKVVFVWARDLQEGLQALISRSFDAALIDYDLGLRTGFDFIREAMMLGFDTPMILVTGHGSYEMDLEAMQTGAADYLNKNEITPALLERTIRYSIERKHLLDEIKTRSQQLWQATKRVTLGELSASMAHELNNPLAIISLKVESLSHRTDRTSQDFQDLQVIQKEIDRMASQLASLMEFRNSKPHQVSTVDIGKEIRKTIELMQTHLANRHINIQLGFSDEPLLIHVDRQQIRQLFLNIITNASDAMPEGGMLAISMNQGLKADQLIIEIRDTGIGIPNENLPRVMVPFFTTKLNEEGAGLGLAICRRIVEEHHGTIQITSPGPGGGTTVRIVLPAYSGNLKQLG